MGKRKAHIRKEHDHKYWIGSRTSPDRHLENRHLKDIYVQESEDGKFKSLIKDFDSKCIFVVNAWLQAFDYNSLKQLVRQNLKDNLEAYFDSDLSWEMIDGYLKYAEVQLKEIMLKNSIQKEQPFLQEKK